MEAPWAIERARPYSGRSRSVAQEFCQPKPCRRVGYYRRPRWRSQAGTKSVKLCRPLTRSHSATSSQRRQLWVLTDPQSEVQGDNRKEAAAIQVRLAMPE